MMAGTVNKENVEYADVIIIGAGVCGAAIARELAKHRRKIVVLEAASDVCEGTSKANSGIVHAGYDAMPGTLKAQLNVKGNAMMEKLSEELDFPFRRNGSLVLCLEEEGIPGLQELLERGRKNGVEGLRLLTAEEIREMEPEISVEAVAALYAPSGGIVCPFGLNIALAENACDNGVEFYFNCRVEKIEKAPEYRISAGDRRFCAPVVINAAGVYADVIHNMVSRRRMRIVPRKGEYCLMDKQVGKLVNSTVFQLPSRLGKGILVTPTVHGNLLAGPTAEDIPDKEGVNTTASGLELVLQKGKRSVPKLPDRQVITSFAGLRAHLVPTVGEEKENIENGYTEKETEDFIIGEAEDAPGFWDVAGIESPGLTSAPAIGEYVAEQVNARYPAPLREDFIARRTGVPNMAQASAEERSRLIEQDDAYANVICRCELVTEGEIRNAIHRTLGATTLDGVKRRTRAGMGRCQAGFCSPRTVEILAEELGIDSSEITKAGGESHFLTGYGKGGLA